ncbi:unnamed protein product, partial [Closterium sp. NIES-53]
DLHVLRLHSDRGGEFSSDILRDFCQGEGILQSSTLSDSPHQYGIAERRSYLDDPCGCSPFSVAVCGPVRCASAQPLAPCHLVGDLAYIVLDRKVGDASVFRVWVSPAFVRDTSTDKLSARAFPCVFLGFSPNAPGWQFYHPTSCPTLSEVAVGSGASRGAASGGAESEGAKSGGAEPGGAEPRGVEPRGAEPGGVEPGGSEASLPTAVARVVCSAHAFEVELPELQTLPLETLELEVLELLLELVEPEVLQLLVQEVLVQGVLELPRQVVLGELELETLRSLELLGLEELELLALELEALVREALELEEVELLTLELESQTPLQPTSPLPAPSPYTRQTGGLTEHREPASCPASPVHTGRQVPRPRPPPVPGSHAMALRPSSIPLRVPLPPPPESSLPSILDPESDRARATSPTVSHLLATAVTDPSFESIAASALVAELLDFAAA